MLEKVHYTDADNRDDPQVSISCHQMKAAVPDDPRRFDSCTAVLGKQSFTSGRHYWVVQVENQTSSYSSQRKRKQHTHSRLILGDVFQVGDKTDWDLGVARESISKKGLITVRPDNGYWAICRRKSTNLWACAGPSIALHLQDIPQKVSVFLDYEQGFVSFYNTEAKTHIHTYSGCSFTEPLYPYFNPCLHDNGKNTAPLIICPVDVSVTL